MEDAKVCRTCGETKPWSSFAPRGKVCRVCRTVYHQGYYQKNKERHKEQRDAWYAANKEHHKELRDRWRNENAEHNKRINDSWRAANPERARQGVKAATNRNWLNALARERITSAIRKGVPVSITKEEILEIYQQQGGLCAVTKIPMVLKTESGIIRNWNSPSIDKIVPELGYVPGNVRWVCFAVNVGKWHFTDEMYISICSAVVSNQKPEAKSIESG